MVADPESTGSWMPPGDFFNTIHRKQKFTSLAAGRAPTDGRSPFAPGRRHAR